MKLFFLLLYTLVLGLCNNNLQAYQFDSLGKLSILEHGRVKPLDSFSRNLLLSVSRKTSVQIDEKKASAIHWLTLLMTRPNEFYQRADFEVNNTELIETLGIYHNKSNTYSYDTLITAFNPIVPQLRQWSLIEPSDRTPIQNELMKLYFKMDQYFQVSRSLTIFFRDIEVQNEVLLNELGMKYGQKVNYLHFSNHQDKLKIWSENLELKNYSNLTPFELATYNLLKQLNIKFLDQQSNLLQIVPSHPKHDSESWNSPWTLMRMNQQPISTFEKKCLDQLQTITDSIISNDVDQLDRSINNYLNHINQSHLISIELFYNNFKFFFWSHWLYLLSFCLLMCSWVPLTKNHRYLMACTVGLFLYYIGELSIGRSSGIVLLLCFAIFRNNFYKLASLSLILGALMHSVGMIFRMTIMERPPVTTLYESIIFVGLISVLFCLILEKTKSNGVGIFAASLTGFLLHKIAFRYELDGDTLGVLAAVLNTNFWLGTHVVTISIGYGCTLVAGTVGHIYLFQAIKSPHDKTQLKEINKTMVGLSLVSLLFMTVGTILGGIWGDQSWGRFWGWDPKENGAMLICLALLILIHGRLCGILKPLTYAYGLVLTNIIVALAWFGVNLLNVGLHSYGFTDSIALNLGIFCGLEFLIGTLGLVIAHYRAKPSNPSSIATS